MQDWFLEFGAEIELEQLPLSSAVEKYITQTHDWSPVLSGGDDYQLCLTLNNKIGRNYKKLAQQYGVRITQIGRVVEQKAFIV